MSDSDSEGCGCFAGALIVGAVLYGMFGGEKTVEETEGDLSRKGGSPTVRVAHPVAPDDPLTSNDESNDQPVGYYGTMTLSVTYSNSGSTYSLDGDIEGTELRRLYFPKGGWIDFYSCELDEDKTGYCVDEEGRSWTINGEGGASDHVGLSDFDSEEAEDEDDSFDDDANEPDDGEENDDDDDDDDEETETDGEE
jgi:hypothetical protein